MSDVVLSCAGLSKTYGMGDVAVPVLRGVDFEVRRGESVAIVGVSGSGKSTLLHLLGGLDSASAGSVMLLDQDLSRLDPTAQGRLRNEALGFVYQFHHLLPEFTALENVAMPLLIARLSAAEAWTRARALLEELGLGSRVEHRPGALSGGEQQRVAVARALVQSPRAVLADEPTGNLDPETGDRLHELLRRLNKERRITVVVVTHNERLAAACDRTLRLLDGKLRPAERVG